LLTFVEVDTRVYKSDTCFIHLGRPGEYKSITVLLYENEVNAQQVRKVL